MDNRTSSSLLSPPVRDATSHARNHLLSLLQDLHEENHADAQEVRAALTEILQLISDQQIPPSVPTGPAPPPLQYSHKTVDRLMYSLHRTDVSSLAEDDRLCEICFLCFDEWRWEERQITNNAVDSEPFQVQVDMMPENPVRLSCGHIFGELCLRTWMMQIIPKGPPTCPKCRAKLTESAV